MVGEGRHPGCTCPMTGDPPAWHHDDCAAHDPDARESGCWVAYYGDYSDVVVFDREADALRHAVSRHMQVKRVAWGESLRR